MDEYNYKIFTKEDCKRYRLSGMKAPDICRGMVECINSVWEKISKGYNFVIGTGKEDLMFYDVKYFNDYILGNKPEPGGVD